VSYGKLYIEIGSDNLIQIPKLEIEKHDTSESKILHFKIMIEYLKFEEGQVSHE